LGDQVISGSLQHDRTITIGPGENLHNTLVHTMGTPRGPVIRQESGSVTIGKPKRIQSLAGGGDAVWIFENGTLTLLRTYRSGATKWRSFLLAALQNFVQGEGSTRSRDRDRSHRYCIGW
jgi:hypothetical protein